MARAAITDRTRAILVVHAYCSCADLDAFGNLSAETGIPIVEDCSQAHASEWRGRKVGTFGQIGVFSLQQTKVLTCGEGGVTITSSPELHDRLQQFRADGRRFGLNPVVGQLELEEVGAVHGHNYCMSEFNAATALAQLELLDGQNELRERNADLLSGLLGRIPGVSTLPRPAQVTGRTYYDYVIRLDPGVLGPFSVDRVVAALTAELNLFFETLDTPLNGNRLYDPLLVPGLARTEEERRRLDPTRFDLPEATAAHRTCVAFLHHALLAGEDDVAAIATAVEKVLANVHHLG
jgi:L-glutamine:scyllo-inosose aminotransferase/L-glutamine:2-deoxy-scyllo-inosose/3-amino-2,3-dideoxy-scyllo-inosose aminotransferase